MIRKATLLLSLMFACLQQTWGQVSFFDAKVSEYGQLEQVLGDKWNSIDSLIVHGPINETDFKTIARCAKEGKVKSVNLKNATVPNHKIPDYAFAVPENKPFSDYSFLNIHQIILPDDIIELGEYAFVNMKLRHIELPSSLRKFGNNCFDGNYWLENDPLIIPEGVKEIPIGCFAKCVHLKKVILPSTIENIDFMAFLDTGLEEINLPEGLVSIADNAFHNSQLTKVKLPSSVTTLGSAAFSSIVEISEIVFPESMSQIPDFICVGDINLDRLTIPESVTKIGIYAFRACHRLKVKLPRNIEIIGEYAFDNTATESLILPASVKEIGNRAFGNNNALRNIYSASPTPPQCFGDPFGGSTSHDIPLYVPIGAAERYKTAEGWNLFTNIIETDDFTTAIKENTYIPNQYEVYCKDGSIVIDSNSENVLPTYFSIVTIDGKIIDQGSLTQNYSTKSLEGGIYLVKIGKKVIKVFL